MDTQPKIPSRAPYVIQRTERHPSGATFVTYLDIESLDHPAEPRWRLTPPTSREALYASDVHTIWPFLRSDLASAAEPWTLEVRSWGDVYREHIERQVREQTPDFHPARIDQPADRTRLAQAIGTILLGQKERARTDQFAPAPDEAAQLDDTCSDTQREQSLAWLEAFKRYGWKADEIVNPRSDDEPRSLRSDRDYRAFDSSEGRGLDGPSLC